MVKHLHMHTTAYVNFVYHHHVTLVRITSSAGYYKLLIVSYFIAERLSARQLILRRISEIVCMYVCMYVCIRHAQESNYFAGYAQNVVSRAPV